MKNVIVGLVFGALVLISALEASACNRCGLFGNQCKYYAPTYVAPYVAPVYAAQPVYVVQNNYPQPLVPVGSSSYTATSSSFQQSVLPFFDPNRAAASTLELQRATTLSAAQQSERALALFQRFAELQAPAVERIAAGSAAAMVLQAAGLDPAHNQNGSSQAVVINRDAQGRVQVLPLTSEQTLKLTTKLNVGPQAIETVPAPPVAENVSMLAKYCYTCHGVEKAEPAGKFFMGDDPTIAKSMKDGFFKITQKISKGEMPPAKAAQPTKEERVAIINEIEQLILAHSEGGEK